MSLSWISFKGIRTDTLPHVLVQEMPSHRRASMRYTRYQIKGRDGDFHVNEGYGNFDVGCTLVLIKGNVNDRYAIDHWATGTGKLITSDDPDRAYLATANEEVRWQRDKADNGFYDTARITFSCQPYMVEANDTTETFDAPGSLVNAGNAIAYPTISVYGSGDCSLAIGETEVQLRDVELGVPVILDCENGYVYSSSGGGTTMVGEFPVIPEGTSNVRIGFGTTKLEIVPHWRWY